MACATMGTRCIHGRNRPSYVDGTDCKDDSAHVTLDYVIDREIEEGIIPVWCVYNHWSSLTQIFRPRTTVGHFFHVGIQPATRCAVVNHSVTARTVPSTTTIVLCQITTYRIRFVSTISLIY